MSIDQSEAPRFGCLFSTPLVERVRRDEIAGSGATVLQPLPPLKVDQELDLLKACLDDAGRKVRFLAACATLDNFQRLLALGCRAVHFTGHGVVGKVGFELEKTTNRTYSTGEQYLVDVTQMRQLLAGSSGSGGAGSGGAHGTQLVFVSACHSASIAGVFVEAGVRHVVAVDTKHEVQDMAAVIFERTFYRQLLLGQTVRAAFDAAQATVATSPECPPDEGSKFLLLPTDSDSATDAPGRHDNSVFGDAAPGKWEDELTPLPPPVDTVAEFFVGRQRDVQQVLNFFVSKCARMVTVAGIHGVGKTQVALRFCEYARQRRLFNSLHFAALGTAAKRARRRSRAARRSAAGLRFLGGSPRAAMSGSVAAAPEEEQPPTMAALVARAFGVSLAYSHASIGGRISGSHRVGRRSSRDSFDSSGSGRSDADADAEAEAEEGYVLERVREICAEKEREDGGGRRQLIVLDGCDDYLLAEATAPDGRDDSSGSGFCSFLTRLLSHVPSLSVLATSVKGVNECGKVENVAVRLVQISNFEPISRESGMLFSVRCGRPLRKSEIAFGDADVAHASSDTGHAAAAVQFGHRAGAAMVSAAAVHDNDYFLQLAHHPVVRELQGHPGALCDVAHQVSSEGLDLASAEHVQKLMTQVVPGIFDSYYGSSGTSMFRHSVHIHPSLASLSPRNALGGPYHPQLRHSISASVVQGAPRASSDSPELRTSKSYQVAKPTGAAEGAASGSLSDMFGYAPLDTHVQAQSQAKRFEVARDAMRNLIGGAVSDESEAFVQRGAQLWALAAVETGSPPDVATFAALRPSLGMFFNRGVAPLDGIPTQRRLDEAGMRFLGSSTKIWGRWAPLAPDGTPCNVVRVDAFAGFFRWFDALVPVVRHTGLWDSVQPIKLHGFVNDAEAQRLLAGRAHGTFLLRFSESKPGTLAVSNVHATGRIAKTLITVDVHAVPGSEYSMRCGNTTRSCGSLSGLLHAVCGASGLLRLYPDHDPHDVFAH